MTDETKFNGWTPKIVNETHKLDPKYWIRTKRRNEENLVLAKMIAKHLIMQDMARLDAK